MASPNLDNPPEQEGHYIATPTINESHVETTIFKDDADGSSASIVQPTSGIYRKYLGSKQAPATTDLRSYLNRPTSIATGNFSASNSGVLASGDLSSFLSLLKKDRIKFMYAMKFKLKMTLQVNGDRFQAGRYILAWLPLGGGVSFIQSSSVYAMHFANLTTITQLPHVELDLAKQTSATLEVPFQYTLPGVEYLSSGVFNVSYGNWAIVTYSPLNTGSGGTTAPFTLWGSFQDVEFTSVSVTQMADISTAEANAQGVGPVTRTLATVSKSVGVLGELPLIGGYAKTVSWISSVLSRSASYWGWSKPSNLEAPTRMIRQILPYSAVSDVTANPRPLGLVSTNSVVPHNGIGGTDVDEMSVDFIKNQYAYIGNFTWNASGLAKDFLWGIDVAPSNFVTTWSKGFCYSPVAFLHSLCAYWRGGFKFRFKIVKTEFHRGRLMVAFSPQSTAQSSPGFTYDQTELIFREIVDISTSSEFEVCVPYMVVRNWMKQSWSIGYLAIFIENPLTAPSSVGNTCKVLVEVKGDDDFEVAAPLNPTLELYAPSTTQMADPYVVTPCIKLGVSSPAPDIGQYTMGEKMTSLRQIIKRMYGLTNPYGAIIAGNTLHVRGYAVWITTQAATTTGALSRPILNCDPLNLIQGLYAFSTGSMRYIFRDPNKNVLGMDVHPVPTPFYLMNNVGGNSTLFDKSLISSDIEGVAEVQLPVWQTGFARALVDHLEGSNLTTNISLQYGNPTTLMINSPDATGTTNLFTYRQAGDDFNCFGWIGVPAMVLKSAT